MSFFVLQNPKADKGSSVTDFLSADGSKTGAAPRCPVCGKYLGMLPLLPPVSVELETWGPEFGDIAFGTGDGILISERFLHLYRASGLSGMMEIAPVDVVKWKSHKKCHMPIPRYHLCNITRSRATIDDEKSGLESDPPWTCEECRLGGIIKRARRIVLQPNSWPGEDIFYARGLPGTILTSQKFESFCRRNRISNCTLVPAEEFYFDFYPCKVS